MSGEQNSTEEDRYHRQKLVKGWSQEKLAASRVLLVGAGAVGCETAKNLVLSGIGELVIVDSDTVELSNLNRQFLYEESDVGGEKASIAAEKLRLLNPDVKVRDVHGDVTKMEDSFFPGFNVYLGCVDNIIARYYLNRKCVETNTPYVDAGTNVFFASLQVVVPGKTPCLECHSLHRGVGRRSCLGNNKNPAITTTSAIIGAIQAQEALKILLNIGEITGNHTQFDTFNHILTAIPLDKNPSCPICGDEVFEQMEFKADTVQDLQEILEPFFGCKPLIMKGKNLIKDSTLIPGDILIAVGGGRKVKIKNTATSAAAPAHYSKTAA